MFNLVKYFAVLSCTLSMVACGGSDSDSARENYQHNENATKLVGVNKYDAARRDAFDLFNSWRTQCGYNSVEQNEKLDEAAQFHANYLMEEFPFISHYETNKNNIYYTGFNALDRASAAGFEAQRVTEIIAADKGEHSNTAIGLATAFGNNALPPAGHLKRLIASVYHMQGAFMELQEFGLGYSVSKAAGDKTAEHYYSVASISLATDLQTDSLSQKPQGVRTFPCNGVDGVLPVFYPELPNPYGDALDLSEDIKGHPIMLMAENGSFLKVTSFELMDSSGVSVETREFNAGNDIHQRLQPHEVFFVPETALKANETYKVVWSGSANNAFYYQKEFSFATAEK